MVVMLVWRIERWRSSKAAIVLISCPGLLLESILIMASNPSSFTSTSAKHDLFSAVSSRSTPPPSESVTFPVIIWGLLTEVMGEEVVVVVVMSPRCLLPVSPKILRRFCDSRHCRSCSSSRTNSIAPPMIDAWSPYYIACIIYYFFTKFETFTVIYMNTITK